jgi:hypothetical protein
MEKYFFTDCPSHMTDKFTKNLGTSVFHVMQTVICITEDLWKVIPIVIGLVWFPHTHTHTRTHTFYTHLPAYEDGTECSETSAYKLQTPGNYPEESIKHSVV